MSTKAARGFTIEFPSTARLLFRGFGAGLVINPRTCQGTSDGIDLRRWPNCSNKPHACNETGLCDQPIHVPANRVIDESGDYADRWFAFWEEDCMSPPIYIVRAESFEQAYEDFCETLQSADASDWSDEEKGSAEDPENGNIPDGYRFTNDGRIVFTENVNGREIELAEVTT